MNVIKWQHNRDILTKTERKSFMRLSVFDGWFWYWLFIYARNHIPHGVAPITLLFFLAAYQAVAQQTSRHHYVFQDATTYCKMGHVRYSMNLASSDHYPVNREFAFDVCQLPTTYNQAVYMQFIEDWGTVRVFNVSKSLVLRRIKPDI